LLYPDKKIETNMILAVVGGGVVVVVVVVAGCLL